MKSSSRAFGCAVLMINTALLQIYRHPVYARQRPVSRVKKTFLVLCGTGTLAGVFCSDAASVFASPLTICLAERSATSLL
jgi:hypothetical protein